jgi:hypothetical protein
MRERVSSRSRTRRYNRSTSWRISYWAPSDARPRSSTQALVLRRHQSYFDAPGAFGDWKPERREPRADVWRAALGAHSSLDHGPPPARAGRQPIELPAALSRVRAARADSLDRGGESRACLSFAPTSDWCFDPATDHRPMTLSSQGESSV